MVNGFLPSLSEPKTLADRRFRLFVARAGAEGASIGAGIGAIYMAEKLTPQKLHGLKDFVATRIVAPRLAMFDALADKMPGIEGQKGIEDRHAMTPEQRAKYFASGIVDTTVMAGGGIVGQTLAQGLLDHMAGLHLTGTTMQQWGKTAMATAMDKGVMLGSIAVLSTGTPQLSEKLQHSVAQNVLKRLGYKEDKEAENRARQIVIWQIPNALGALGSFASLDRAYQKDRPL